MKKLKTQQNTTPFIKIISYFFKYICNAVILSCFAWALIKLILSEIFSINFQLNASRKTKVLLLKVILVIKVLINVLKNIKDIVME